MFTSELFDVRVIRKWVEEGLTRDRCLIEADLIEQDPLVQRTAIVEVPRGTYDDVTVGERAALRLYKQPNGEWSTKMPFELQGHS